MSRVQAQTFVRSGENFLPVSEVPRYEGDCYYVPGALSLIIDRAEVLGTGLWDDVNWLWPLWSKRSMNAVVPDLAGEGFPTSQSPSRRNSRGLATCW